MSEDKTKLQQLQAFFTRFSFRGILAVIIVLGGVIFLFILLYKKIPEQNKETINIAMGFVLANLSIVANWYFGSSKEKSDQDKATALVDAPNNGNG